MSNMLPRVPAGDTPATGHHSITLLVDLSHVNSLMLHSMASMRPEAHVPWDCSRCATICSQFLPEAVFSMRYMHAAASCAV